MKLSDRSIENKWKPLRSTMQTTLQSDASTLALINRYNVVTQLASSSASKGEWEVEKRKVAGTLISL